MSSINNFFMRGGGGRDGVKVGGRKTAIRQLTWGNTCVIRGVAKTPKKD